MEAHKIKGILQFIEWKSYDWENYYLLTIKPEIRRYMTAHAFQDRPTGGIFVHETEDTTEKFNSTLEEMKKRAAELTEEQETFIAACKDLSSVEGKNGILLFKASQELQNFGRAVINGQNYDMVAAIETCSGKVDLTPEGLRNAIGSYPFLFSSIYKYILTVFNESIGQRKVFWTTEKTKYDRNPDKYHKYCEDERRVYPDEKLQLHEDWPSVAYLGETLKFFLDEAEQKAIDEIISSGLKPDEKRLQIGKMISAYHKKSTIEEDADFLRELIGQYWWIWECSEDDEEGLDQYKEGPQREEYQGMLDLVEFYEKLAPVYKIFEKHAKNLLLIAEYAREDAQKESEKYRSIRDSLQDELDVKKVGKEIPYVSPLGTIFEGIPTFDEIERKMPKSKKFPTMGDMRLLNEINQMLVRKVMITTEYNETSRDRTSVQRAKTVSEEIQMVGFVNSPIYMIEVHPAGLTIEGKKYEDKEYKDVDDSLPSRNRSIDDYIKHVKAFRYRRRGKVYCIFYHNRVPYAADEENIYPLDPVVQAGCGAAFEKKLIQLKNLIVNNPYSFVDAARIATELRANAEKWSAARGPVDKRRLDNLIEASGDLSNPIKKRTFEAEVNQLKQKYTSGGKMLDFYTQEALLYVWVLSKINLTQRDDTNINYRDITHTEFTYLVASVRRPDDLFYRKPDGLESSNNSGHHVELPYDVKILSSNIFPRLILTDVMQMPVIRSDRVDSKSGIIKVEFNDLCWMRKFKAAPCLEVFDEKTMSDTIYCSRDEFMLECLTGPSLQVEKVANRIRILRDEKITHKQYTLAQDLSIGELLKYLSQQVANPLLLHYLTPKTLGSPQDMMALVKQALNGIAYTLYCKLRYGNTELKLQDMTAAINSTVFHKYPFTHTVTKNEPVERPNFLRKHKKSIYNIDCQIATIDEKSNKYFLVPRHKLDATTTSDQAQRGLCDSVMRIIPVGNEEDKKTYYTYLMNLYRDRGSGDKRFSTAEVPAEEYKRLKNVIDRINTPEILKAQVLGCVCRSRVAAPNSSALATFIANMKAADNAAPTKQASGESATPWLFETTYGVQGFVNGNKLLIKDQILGEEKEFQIPFEMPLTFRTIVQNVENGPNEPFVGSMDMTFLTLLDNAMYNGEQLFLNELFSIYHGYNDEFSHERLGTFLWDELIMKQWGETVTKRIYYLISYQSRNLIIQSSNRVSVKEGRIQITRPATIRRRALQLRSIGSQ